MRVDDVRDALDGMQRSDEISADFRKRMAAHGIVAAFCPNSRTVEVFGASTGEFRIGKGFVASSSGLRPSEADDDHGFLRAVRGTDRPDYGPVPLSFETNTNHEPFSVLDDDSLFCLGVVFSLNDTGRSLVWEDAQ